MARVTGIGGVFFKAQDPEATRAWYQQHLGIEAMDEYGWSFLWRDVDRPDRVGEIYLLTHNPDHHWYWAPEMTPDEIFLIKGWDSLDDGRARFTPHAAFPLPGQDDAPARESIEVRTLVVIE